MNDRPTSGTVLKTISMIYLAIVTVMVIFSLFVFYQNNISEAAPIEDRQFTLVLRYVLFVFAPMGVIAGYFIFKKLISAIPQGASLREKINRYQIAMLIRAACLEGPGLLAAVFAFISKDNSFLLITAIIVVLFGLLRPTVYGITSDLNLSPAEAARLNNPDSPLD